jgi:hypothetical protein
MKNPIPEGAYSQNTIVLGKTRAGKSSTVRLVVEELLDAGKPVCIIDPKGDWWGLKSTADGKKAGYPIVIFGGAHADVPINAHSGAAVAELIATGNRPCLIDLKGWTVSARTKFFVDFAEALFAKTRGMRWLVIDECHNFAPQGKVLDPASGQMLHWANRLANEGSGLGLTLISASQRPQKIHKDYVTAHETLIAKRVIHPLDRNAVKDWIDGCGDPAKGKEVVDSLAGMKREEGWIWSPEIGLGPVFVTFPMFRTFDSFKPRSAEEPEKLKGWASVNLDEVKTKLAAVVEEAKANDPAALKAEIANLRKASAHLADPKRIADWFKTSPRPPAATAFTAGSERQIAYLIEQAEGSGAADPKALEEAQHTGFTHGKAVGKASGYVEGWDAAISTMRVTLADLPRLEIPAAAEARLPKPTPKPAAAERAAPVPKPKLAPVINYQPGAEALTPSLQKVLDAIAWWRNIGVEPVRRERASVVAGYSPKASTFGVYIADLVKRGYIETAPGTVQLTDEGLALANAPTATSREELRDMARALLDPQPARVFDVIYDAYPGSIRRDDVAESVGLSPKASTCGVYIAAVAAYGIIEADGRGTVRAADWLFP